MVSLNGYIKGNCLNELPVNCLLLTHLESQSKPNMMYTLLLKVLGNSSVSTAQDFTSSLPIHINLSHFTERNLH